MDLSEPLAVEAAPLPYLLSLPGPAASAASPPLRPLLCFLHGFGEAAPLRLREALVRHGPLSATASRLARQAFIVVAVQLPQRGEGWRAHGQALLKIVRELQVRHAADPARSYLTGFSGGGNGVFELALDQPSVWAALWPVDPTRVPRQDPGLPVWMSSGEVSRHYERAFLQRLSLRPLYAGEPSDRVYVDQGEDHAGTARLAYRDDRIYRWLLSKQLGSLP